MSEHAGGEAADPHASLLEAFIASPHEWLALQQYCEASGLPYWEPGAGHALAHPLDPLSELMLGLSVASLLEGEPGDGDRDEDGDGDRDGDRDGDSARTRASLVDLCDHTFTHTAAWLRDTGMDEVAVYQQLLERDVFCDHEVVEQLLIERGGTLAVLTEGWVAGGDHATVDRLVSDKVVEISSKEIDAGVLAEGPLTGVWKTDRLGLWRQLMGGMHLVGLAHEAADVLRQGERLVLAAAFPYEEAEPPVVVVAVQNDCWVVDAQERFDDDVLQREDHHRLDTLVPALGRYDPPPPRAAGFLPSEDQEDWVIEHLADLVERQGSEPLLQPPILDLPFKPQKLSGEDGVRQVLRFIMNASGLEPLALLVRLASYPDVLAAGSIVHPHAGQASTLGWFEGIEGDRCVFGVDLSQHWDLDGLVGTLSHEVAHAWRHHHDLVVPDPVEEELLTDLTTLYLGFGLYTTNTSSRMRTWSDLAFTSYQQHEKAGYLPTVVMSYGLALTVAARGGDRGERRRIARRLETDQRAYFKTASTYLDEADELVEELGLGPRRRRAPLRERRVPRTEPFEPRDTVEVWEGADDPDDTPREPVFGMRNSRPTAITWLAMAAGVAAAIAMGLRTEVGIFAFLFGLAWVFLMYFYGPGTRCHVCTVCEARIQDQDTRCPGCGGQIHGRVEDGYQWLDAKERLEGTHDDGDDGDD